MRATRWSFSISIVFLCVVAILSSSSAHSQITYNTALPITEGNVIVRIQTKFLHFDPASDNPNDARLSVWTVPLVVVYGWNEKIALFGILPYTEKRLQIGSGPGLVERKTRGIGDVTILVRYTLLQRDRRGQTMRIAPFVGARIPTGRSRISDRHGLVPRSLQPGSGAWAPIVGAAFTWQHLSGQWDGAFRQTLPIESRGYRFGSETRLDVGYRRRILPTKLSSGVPLFLYLALESNLIWQQKDRISGGVNPDSGGITWYVAPGLQLVSRRWILETALQVPLFQDRNGRGFESRWNLTLSTRMNF